MRKICIGRKKVNFVKDGIRKGLEEKVTELVYIGEQNLWGHFNDGILWTRKEVHGKRGKRSRADTLWWREEENELISRKKDAHKGDVKE